MNSLSILLVFALVSADDKPKPKFPLGKETTYITEPLDKDGYLDYEAALNDRLGKGITPEKNANVLLWKALGPRPEGGKGMPAEYFKRLGIDEPPQKGDYFIALDAYVRDRLKLDQKEIETVLDQQSAATGRPWSAKDIPHIAAWLKDNEKPLAIVVQATKRPDYFNPLASHRAENGPSNLLGATFPSMQKCRELATAFAARAMLRVGEGKYDEAWQDLLTCHRLGRLVGRGATLIEALVGAAIEMIASRADLVYLERAGLTGKQVLDRTKDLQTLASISPGADTIDLGERLMFLDTSQMVRRMGIAGLEGISGGDPTQKPDPEAEKAFARIDWEPALRNGNKWYDRMAAAMRLKDRAAREKELDQIEAELKAIKKALLKTGKLYDLLLTGEVAPREAGETIGNVLINLLLPAVRKVQNAYDRVEQVQRNLQVAFALAAYHSDAGKYPGKLDDLAPKYLPKVPDDLFVGRALIYKPTDKGYLFYSVGANGKDDEGRWTDDEPQGDDIGVRMPLPERKRKK
jgi:hypothetical protein